MPTPQKATVAIPRMKRRARVLLIFGVLIAMHMTCGIVHAHEIVLQCVLSLKSCLDTFVYYGGVWLQHIAAFWLQYFTFLYAIVASVLTLYLIKVFPKSNFNPISDLGEACDCVACRHGWYECDRIKHHRNNGRLPVFCIVQNSSCIYDSGWIVCGGGEHKFTLYHDFQPSDSVVVPFS